MEASLLQFNHHNQFYKENIMKYLIAALLGLAMTATQAEAEMKKVCHDEQKNGKTVEVCKTIKVHKKLEGAAVPTSPNKK